jgi:hypothetical protein
MKQTAVEWLVEEMINKLGSRIENTTEGCELFEQAKKMEKEQIINAFNYGQVDLGMETDEYCNNYFKSE